jgi:hypothetical protein
VDEDGIAGTQLCIQEFKEGDEEVVDLAWVTVDMTPPTTNRKCKVLELRVAFVMT